MHARGELEADLAPIERIAEIAANLADLDAVVEFVVQVIPNEAALQPAFVRRPVECTAGEEVLIAMVAEHRGVRSQIAMVEFKTRLNANAGAAPQRHAPVGAVMETEVGVFA